MVKKNFGFARYLNKGMRGSAHCIALFSTEVKDTSIINDVEDKLQVLLKKEPCEFVNKTKRKCEKDQKALVPIIDSTIKSKEILTKNVQKRTKQVANMSIAEEIEIKIYVEILKRKSHKSGKFQCLSDIIFDKEILALAYRQISKAKGSITKGGDDNTIDFMSMERLELLSQKLQKES